MVPLNVTKFAPVIINCACEILPQIVVDGLPGKLSRCLLELCSKNFVVFIPARESDQAQPRREITVSGQIVKSRNKFSVRQISGCAENHDRTRLRHGTTCEPLEQWINRHFVGHNTRLSTEAVTRTYVSRRVGVNNGLSLCHKPSVSPLGPTLLVLVVVVVLVRISGG